MVAFLKTEEQNATRPQEGSSSCITSPPLIILSILVAPVVAADCTTEEGKAEAANDFLWKHYDPAGTIVHASEEDGLFELYFFPYQSDGSEEPECSGWVRVDDQCRVTDAQGRSLEDAGLREQVLTCR